MLVALLALFVALGGSSYAALKLPKNSVGPNQLRKNAVTSSKVKAGSLLANDLKGSARSALRGPEGPRGATGPAGAAGTSGAPGAPGAPGSALAYAHVSDTGTVDAANSKNIVQANVTHPQAGVYCFDDLSFTPHSIHAIIGGSLGTGSGPVVPTIIANIPSFSICTSEAEVGMVDPSTGGFSRNAAFWVIFN
jgi:hypothetical protein